MSNHPNAKSQSAGNRTPETTPYNAANLVWWRNKFLTGLFIIIPLAATLYVLFLIYRLISALFDPLVRQFVSTYRGTIPEFIIMNGTIPGAALLMTVILILFVGLFASNVLFKKFSRFVDRLLSRIPLVNIIYPLTKQVVDSVKRLGDAGTDFQSKKVVFVKFPAGDGYLVGFQTGELLAANGDRLLTIFIPTAPNPITGFVLVFHEEAVIPSGMSMDAAWKFLISAGLISPNQFNHPLATHIAKPTSQVPTPDDTMQKD